MLSSYFDRMLEAVDHIREKDAGMSGKLCTAVVKYADILADAFAASEE